MPYGLDPTKKKKKKKEQPDATTQTVQNLQGTVTVPNASWQSQPASEHRQAAFVDLARSSGISPKQLGLIVSQYMPADMQWQYKYSQFSKQLQEQFGSSDQISPETVGTLFQQWQLKGRFKNYRTDYPVAVGPQTALVTLGLPDLAGAAMSDIFQILSGAYGDVHTAAAIYTALIDDPEQRAATWQAIESIATRPVRQDQQYAGSIGNQGVEIGQTNPTGVNYTPHATSNLDNQDLLMQVLEDPTKFDTLTAGDQQRVIDYANRAVAEEKASNDIAGQISQSRDILMQRHGFNMVLSDQEKQTLKNLNTSFERKTVFGRPAPKLLFGDERSFDENIQNQVGITQFKPGDEQGGPVYTIDKEWAQANFTKAVGVEAYIRQHEPSARFQYGEHGIIGDAFDILNRSTDAIGAPVGSLLTQVKELTQNIRYSPEDRQHYADQAARIKKALADGEVDLKDVPHAISVMMKSEDLAASDFGLQGFLEDTKAYSNPTAYGTGFGDSVTQSLGVYPGDPAYEGTHLVASLVGQLIFDPTIIGAKFIKAARLAELVPAGTTISKSKITQAVFDTLAMEPEVFLESSTAQRAMDTMVEGAKAFGGNREAMAIELSKNLGWSPNVSYDMADAAMRGKEELRAIWQHAWRGEGASAEISALAHTRIGEAADVLNQTDSVLPKLVKSLQGKIRYRTAKAENPKIPDEMRRIADMTDREWLAEVDARGNLLRGTPFSPEDFDTYTYLNDAVLGPQRAEDINAPAKLLNNDIWLRSETVGDATYGLPQRVLFKVDPVSGETLGFISWGVDEDGKLVSDSFGLIARPGTRGVPDELFREALNNGLFSLEDIIATDITLTRKGALYVRRAIRNIVESTQGIHLPTWDEEIADLNRQLVDAQDALAAARAGRSDALAKRFAWESILKGTDHAPDVPIRAMPSARSLRKFSINSTRWGRANEAATAMERALPLRLRLAMAPGDLARFIESNPIVDKLAGRFMQTMRRVGEDTGAGARLWFRPQDVPANQLNDAVARSFQELRNIGVHLGVPTDVIDRGSARILKASKSGSAEPIYEAMTETWSEFISSSRRLNPLGRQALSKLWDTRVGERSPEYIKIGSGTSVVSDPTIWAPRFNDAGDLTKMGVPVLEADLQHGIPLPTLGAMKDYTSYIRAHMKSLDETGKTLGKGIAGAYFGLGNAWHAFNNFWARAILLGRMPTALPLRIQIEQQIRIGAFGYASGVSHPLEWTRSVAKRGDFALFADSPDAFFGTLVKDYLDDGAQRLARTGRQTVNIYNEPEAATRALAARVNAYAASPSARVFLNKKLTDAEVLEKLKADPFYWNNFGSHWDDIIKQHIAAGTEITSEDIIVNRIRTAMNQVIGEGEKADTVRAAALSGKMKVGTEVTEDANVMADQMLQWYREGSWKPNIHEFPRSAGDYLPIDRHAVTKIASDMSDRAFKYFYSKPDLWLGRRPLYRQIAAREYDRLIGLGWGEASAKEAAKTYGARQTADILFTIGANTSADHFLRSVMPFFPAWKELALTWLARIPAEMGGRGVAGWVFGAPALGRTVDAWIKFFVGSGLVYKEGDQFRVHAPGAAPVIRAMTGLDIEDASFSADSFTSLLPVPSLNQDQQWWKGALPTLGAPAGATLHAINKATGDTEFGKELESQLTLFGGNQSLGPASVDTVLNAFGITPPWQSGSSAEMQRIRRDSAFIDALRIAYSEHYDEMPKQKDFKNEKQFLQAQADWLGELYNEAEQGSRKWYLFRGISSMILPASIKYSTKGQQDMTAIWDTINGIQKATDDNSIISPLLESYRQEHPDLSLYLTGKTIKLVPDSPNSTDTFEQYQEELQHGDRMAFTPQQWLVWALGTQEAALHRARLNDIFANFANSPQKWLLSGYDSNSALTKENNRWDQYLRRSEITADLMGVTDAAGQRTNFALMYDNFLKQKEADYGAKGELSTTLEQQKAADALDALTSLSRFFGAGTFTDDDYLAVRRTLNEIVDKNYSSKDPVFKATGRWWDAVRPYFDAKAAVWAKIDKTPSAQRDSLYRQLADIENTWAKKTITDPRFGKMPSPQEVMFNKLSPEAKQLKLVGWARLPVQFLSRFQRQKVYGTSPKDNKIDQLVTEVNKNEAELSRIVDANALSYSSKEYDTLRKRVDRMNRESAQKLGLSKQFALWQLPPYKRIGAIIDNPYWSEITRLTDEGRKQLEHADISPRGSTQSAVSYQRQIVKLVEKFRQEDPGFDHIMKLLEIAYGDGADKPAPGVDTYWPVFFNGFGTAPGYLSYG